MSLLRQPKLSQHARILKLLKAKGTVTNSDLNRIAYRYGARLFDLRREGHIIVSNHVKEGLWEFTYRGHRDGQEDAA